ncbi:MAG: N-acetylmuramoyl-L-alanine amidase [Bacteroidales bacterium]|nr:N-acetylmuramoyl-L-alanine amidase [Bacteroidales bacterium]
MTLDAGHGGKDYGAIGVKTNEKTVTLSVVKQLGALIEQNLPDVKVVYTRDKDVFVELSERAAIANKAGSDLFMSVHINSVDKKNRNRTRITGCQVYTLGLHKTAENLAVAKRENAVMELEADHTEKYAGFNPNSLESDIVFELSQNHRLDQSIEFADAIHGQLVKTAGREPKGVRQAGFWVLWATSMPSVLVELDFICNPEAEKFMASDEGQEEMVIALYNALCAYINTYGAQTTGENIKVAEALVPTHAGYHRHASGEAPHLAVNIPEIGSTNDETGAKVYAETITNVKQTAGIPEISSDTDEPMYYVQILASAEAVKKGSSELKGLTDVEYYKDGGMYKYAVGKTTQVSEAQTLMKTIRRTFPGCFIIKMVNGKRVDFIK